MSFLTPTNVDFKNNFVRDFPYGSTSTSVMDSDINSAILDAFYNINQGLFGTQEVYSYAFLLLAAHFLVTNLRASSQGISGQYNFLQSGKGVGPVSESFSIPPQIADNPLFSAYCKTNYGSKYLMFIIPLLSGQMFSVCGGTNA